jgi:hypothetical protein
LFFLLDVSFVLADADGLPACFDDVSRWVSEGFLRGGSFKNDNGLDEFGGLSCMLATSMTQIRAVRLIRWLTVSAVLWRVASGEQVRQMMILLLW